MVFMAEHTHSLENRRTPPKWMKRLNLALHYGDRPWNALTIGMALLIILLVISIGFLLWVRFIPGAWCIWLQLLEANLRCFLEPGKW